ncbi:MAG TPA: ATPase, T2SS/T4P/T4SS family, partial [Parvularculaceae bacterium]|nr:ATPase, T2SS/T4P/T4SS family [Parvularculaceae bacterium]
AEIAEHNERVVILEDTRELRCEAKDSIALRTSQRVTLEALVRSTMRLRPDRIIVGEVRGGEALDLMKAWNTGHPGGIATIHANSAVLALARLEQLIGERSQSASQSLIAEAVDVVAFIEKTQVGRRVTEIIRVTGHDRQQGYMLESADAPELFIVNNGDHS